MEKKLINKKHNILDCTFRDGGYYNNWHFNITLIKKYISIMLKLDVKIVELGFRFIEVNESLGILANTTDKLLHKLNIPKKLKVAVMINAKEFLNYSGGIKAAIDKVFNNASNSRVDLVRVAIHIESAVLCYDILKLLDEKGYSVALNLMQSSSINKKKLIQIVRQINKWSFIKILYFADTFGDMDPDNVRDISSLIQKNFSGKVGFHAHNNKGIALVNSLTALKHGTTFVDSTIMGMGRGAGNTQTENLLLELETISNKKKNSINKLLPILLRDFEKLKNKYCWGTNLYYYLAAQYQIHPTYIQTMLDDKKYVAEGIINTINFLKDKNSSSYNDENMIKAETGKIGKLKGNWKAKSLNYKKDILLIGAGRNVKKYQNEIKNYIKKNNPVVISLNINKYIDPSFINYYLACDQTRIILEAYDYSTSEKALIVPLSRVEKDIKKQIKKSNLKDFGLKIGNENFKTIKTDGCILKKPLAIAYALSFANASKVRNIFLVGMDGYPKNDSNNLIMQDLFDEYNSYNLRNIYAITPTKYNIKKKYII